VTDTVRAVLNVAVAHTWVRETQGANRGEAVNAILARVHLPPGLPWCAAFVSYCGWAVLRDGWPLPLVGGCATLGEAAFVRGLLRQQPAPGAVFLTWSDAKNRYNHTGFVTAQQGHDLFQTVEGNTSPDGSPEGTGVFVRARRFGARDRFIHWWEAPTVQPLPAAA
jgi:hypothetical protein